MSVIERVAVLFNTASRWVAASAWPSRSRPSNSISASIPPGLGGIRIPTGSLPLVITRGPDFGRFRRTFAVSFESSRVFKRSVFTKSMSDTWGTFVKSQFATPPGAPRTPRSGSRNGFRWLSGESWHTALEIFSKFRYSPPSGFRVLLCTRDIFMRCLARSRSSRPSGCLRQATRPAPAGTCSALRVSLCTAEDCHGYNKFSPCLRAL